MWMCVSKWEREIVDWSGLSLDHKRNIALNQSSGDDKKANSDCQYLKWRMETVRLMKL